jgi:hypothetical protein
MKLHSLDHCRPFHIAVFDLARLTLGDRGIEVDVTAPGSGRFVHAGRRFVITVSPEETLRSVARLRLLVWIAGAIVEVVVPLLLWWWLR